MPARPVVSVVIPCYNLGAYLDDAIDSVLAQTWNDLEILILDDGSTDETTIRRLDTLDRPRTTLFRTPNRGLAAARNYLVERARGEFICALDADDRLHPRYLERTIETFRSHSDLSFVSTHLKMFGDESRTWPSEAHCDAASLLAEDTVITAALVRRSAVLDVGGYDEDMPAQGDEDWDLWISLVTSGHRGIILPDVLFYYRRRPGSMCTQCTTGETHLSLIAYLVRKHHVSYAQHLAEVLAKKDAAIAQLESQITQTRHELDAVLLPSIVERRSELDRMRNAIERAKGIVRPQTAPPSEASAYSLPADLDSDIVETVLLERERQLLTLRDTLSHLARRRHAARETLAALRSEHDAVRSAFRAQGREPLDLGDLRRTSPVSRMWGVDRGAPIDRLYIERFLERHQSDIRGRVLEVKDSHYTRRFGGDRVVIADVLDIDPSNPHATIVADLASAAAIPTNTFDCFILTQTLGLIFDTQAAVAEAIRVLKPGGVLLCTLPAAGKLSNEFPGFDHDFWRFTEASIRRLFRVAAPADAFEIAGYGNVLACAAFLFGYAVDEFDPAELEVCDPYFPVVYSVRLVKTLPGQATPSTRTEVLSESQWTAAVRRAADDSTEFVCLVPGTEPDDAWITRAVTQLDTSPRISFVASPAVFRPSPDGDQLDVVGVLADRDLVSGTMIFRRSALDAVGGLDVKMADLATCGWSAVVSLLARNHQGSLLPGANTNGQTAHIDPARARAISLGMIEKHRDLYAAHAIEVVMRKQARTRELLEANYEVEAEVRRLDEAQGGPTDRRDSAR